jgi:hypothetical protein
MAEPIAPLDGHLVENEQEMSEDYSLPVFSTSLRGSDAAHSQLFPQVGTCLPLDSNPTVQPSLLQYSSFRPATSPTVSGQWPSSSAPASGTASEYTPEVVTFHLFMHDHMTHSFSHTLRQGPLHFNSKYNCITRSLPQTAEPYRLYLEVGLQGMLEKLAQVHQITVGYHTM